MKLYLSSLGIPDEKAYRGLLSTDIPRIAIIANGWDVYTYEKTEPYIHAVAETFRRVGGVTEFIDLNKYNMKVDVESKLKDFDAVHVTGGNVFYLKRVMTKSGFWGCIQDLVNKGLVYSGESAGAVIAGNRFDGAEFIDDINQAPEVTKEGLGLVNFGIVPHWGREKYKDNLTKFKTQLEEHAKAKVLRDGETIVVNTD